MIINTPVLQCLVLQLQVKDCESKSTKHRQAVVATLVLLATEACILISYNMLSLIEALINTVLVSAKWQHSKWWDHRQQQQQQQQLFSNCRASVVLALGVRTPLRPLPVPSTPFSASSGPPPTTTTTITRPFGHWNLWPAVDIQASAHFPNLESPNPTYSLHCSSFFWLTKISIIGS